MAGRSIDQGWASKASICRSIASRSLPPICDTRAIPRRSIKKVWGIGETPKSICVRLRGSMAMGHGSFCFSTNARTSSERGDRLTVRATDDDHFPSVPQHVTGRDMHAHADSRQFLDLPGDPCAAGDARINLIFFGEVGEEYFRPPVAIQVNDFQRGDLRALAGLTENFRRRPTILLQRPANRSDQSPGTGNARRGSFGGAGGGRLPLARMRSGDVDRTVAAL